MLIAKNDEVKRSKLWRIVITTSSVLIVVIAVYFLTRMFTSDPLEGTWISEEDGTTLEINGDGMISINIPEILEETDIGLDMQYTLDKEAKTITIREDAETAKEWLEAGNGIYTKEIMDTILGSMTTTFSYSVDQKQLTLTEREYGEQMVFEKQ